MIVSSTKNLSSNPVLKINRTEIIPTSSVNLLGIEIDDKLSFDKDISNVWVKAIRHLNKFDM